MIVVGAEATVTKVAGNKRGAVVITKVTTKTTTTSGIHISSRALPSTMVRDFAHDAAIL